MTAPRVTSCPHCKTSFRITQAQLRAANGSVRCGSCLQVFDANPGVDDKKPPKSEETTAITIPHEQPASNKTEEAIKPVSKPETAAESEDKNAEAISTPESSPAPEQDFSKAIKALDEQEDRENQLIRKHRQKNYLRTASAAFLILTLLFQYAWFNKNTLSLNSKLRPAYEWLCKTVDCSLPPQMDIASIKSLQLMVRSHPDHDDALIVDAVIINNATHLQPYPVLELSFTDINGNLIANREFSAREYLAGELAGSKKMPAGQPIRLALEIIDPGQDAVNYALSFR